jgi:hypothetical protein
MENVTRKHQKPLTEQYVSKYTPFHCGLSTVTTGKKGTIPSKDAGVAGNPTARSGPNLPDRAGRPGRASCVMGFYECRQAGQEALNRFESFAV